ncbi:hypothetical protein LTR85_011566 [Meristemomyces frigidus]|nr:hypothetical protein LTR85_011566 [Meristemomyces frigidus]
MSVPLAAEDSRNSAVHDSPVFKATLRSEESFDILLQPQTGNDVVPLLLSQLEDNAARFRIWVGNIGAHHQREDKRSADYRLRDAPAATARVLELLNELTSTNDELRAIVRGERADQSEGPDEAITDDDDLALLALAEPVSEAHEICLAVSDLITSLLRVSVLLRKATTRDRYAKAAAAGGPSLPTNFDIEHVLHKFPVTAEKQWLAERLGSAITERRQFLGYSRDHHERISARSSLATAATDAIASQPAESRDTTFNATNASTLQPENIKLQQLNNPVLDDDEGYSQGTSRFSSGSDSLRVIPLRNVAEEDAPFECPYCLGMVQFNRYSAWRKHVFRDLRAYVCTFDDCTARPFEDSNTWFRHEQEHHRREWICQTCLGGEKTYESALALLHHVRTSHGQSLLDSEVADRLLRASSRPVSEVAADSACPLCKDREWHLDVQSGPAHNGPVAVGIVKRHLAKHLEELALFAITPDIAIDTDSGHRGDVDELHASEGWQQEATLQWQHGLAHSEAATGSDDDDAGPSIMIPGSHEQPAVRRPTRQTAKHPSWYFTIQIMHPRPGLGPRHGRYGRWNPPKAHGDNVKWIPTGSTMPYTLSFRHDGQATTLANQLPEGIEHYQTYSIYHDEAVFWTVDYDACRVAVADGDEDSSDESEESDGETERDTWAPLTFGAVENNEHPYMSFAGRRQEHRRLLTQRPDQLWAEQLLPNRYQASQETRTRDQRYGGLVGDLPLLVGLMAMAVPANRMSALLPNMIGNLPNVANSWRVYPPTQVPRQVGWIDKRGLVVSVYYDPEETNADELEEYENGEHGPILA